MEGPCIKFPELSSAISQSEASTFIERYFEQYGGVKGFFDGVVEKAKRNGYVETLLGRRRYVPEINSQNRNIYEAARRVVINTPIQGTAADLIKKAMINIHNILVKDKYRTSMLLQVHDELVFEVPEGEIGTLQVQGESIAAYYYRYHDKTKTSMLGEWFNTGDKYYRDAEGYYYYCGRGDDMLKVGGIWVSPIEVEGSLIAHPAVLEAAVVAKRDEHNLIKPKAYVVLKKGYRPSKKLSSDIQTFVKKNIAAYKYPRWIEFVKDLPKTNTGKIQRFKLRED